MEWHNAYHPGSGLALSANPGAGKEVITSRYAQPPPQGFRT
jgi:hypothetical protein